MRGVTCMCAQPRGLPLDVMVVESLLCAKHGAQGSQAPHRVGIITPFYRKEIETLQKGCLPSPASPILGRDLGSIQIHPDIPCILLAGR